MAIPLLKQNETKELNGVTAKGSAVALRGHSVDEPWQA